MADAKKFSWAVIGAGPGGMTAVGMLLDAGVLASEILWIDPDFTVGDFGKFWGEVNSNTKVSLFTGFLEGIKSFGYASRPQPFELDKMDQAGFTRLGVVTKPLQWVTDQLRQQVIAKNTWVRSLSSAKGGWKVETKTADYLAEKVILATGSEPKSLQFPGVEEINLVNALTPSKLATYCTESDTVAVFGSSHSAMIIIRNLVERGVKNIINFYQSPIRYAVLMDDWILYDDTGLKGETAKWVKENISQSTLPQVKRYVSNDDNIDHHLPLCDKVVYAVGFRQRQIPVEGISLSQYDISNGIIAPGLFGIGIGFPVEVTDPFGRKENNVGLWKFLKNIRRTLPIWQQYGL